jgi:hypothetical protein
MWCACTRACASPCSPAGILAAKPVDVRPRCYRPPRHGRCRSAIRSFLGLSDYLGFITVSPPSNSPIFPFGLLPLSRLSVHSRGCLRQGPSCSVVVLARFGSAPSSTFACVLVRQHMHVCLCRRLFRALILYVLRRALPAKPSSSSCAIKPKMPTCDLVQVLCVPFVINIRCLAELVCSVSSALQVQVSNPASGEKP